MRGPEGRPVGDSQDLLVPPPPARTAPGTVETLGVTVLAFAWAALPDCFPTVTHPLHALAPLPQVTLQAAPWAGLALTGRALQSLVQHQYQPCERSVRFVKTN